MDATYIHQRMEGGADSPFLFAFHGTGGDERQLLQLAATLRPDATVIAPRGNVSEHGSARFFRRTGEGIYDMADLAQRTEAMASFIRAQIGEASDDRPVMGIGYSNGANILASVMFSHPDLFDAAVLMHPLIPFEPVINGSLAGKRVLVTAGLRDPICPPNLTHRLISYLEDDGVLVEKVLHPGGHEVRQEELHAAEQFFMKEGAL